MASRLPEEILLQVLGQLPRETTLKVYQTDRRFRRILRPYIFAQFAFHPYATAAKDGQETNALLPSPRKVEQLMERLEFWTSIEIAPFVRICDVRPYTPEHSSHSECSPTDVPYVLLFKFYERLVRFTNLQLLSCIGIHFTQTFLTNLCRLPELATLSVTDYMEAPGHDIDFSRLKFRNLLELNLHDRISAEGTDHSHWIRLLRPEFLTRLKIRLHSDHIPEIDRRPSFPHTTELTLTLATSSQTPDIRRFLSKFPALRVLKIRDHKGEREPADSHEPTTAFSSPLTEYTGPVWTLNTFLHLPTLTYLTVEFCLQTPVLLATLKTIGVQSCVTSLRVSVFTLTSTQLAVICAFFPGLTRLRVEIWSPPPSQRGSYIDNASDSQAVQAFLETLSKTSLPQHLTHLALAWYNESGKIDDTIYPKFRRDLTAKLPSVNAIWLCLFDTMLLWHKTAAGDEEMKEIAFVSVEDEDVGDLLTKIETMRHKFDLTWADLEHF
ncbi:hypothetical protein C8F04DRAFT_1120487 [Mycena alexandri]|uniref:F-box domain-containing protein n=1 Tax=Mycena alexandri TaxID=1745969 RepID=A0AAD6WYH9_9AGAR|nr:hypothetical protein C8F04DRAFT_1120487 [Mycena alexandri]